MSAVLNFYGQLEVHDCPNCSMQFAAPPRFIKERREDGKLFYCPAGHSMSFRQSEVDRLRKRLEQEQRKVEWWKATASSKDKTIRSQKVSLGMTKASLRRTRERVANGVCPCCSRSFQNIKRHMKTKHPDYVKEHSPNEPHH